MYVCSRTDNITKARLGRMDANSPVPVQMPELDSTNVRHCESLLITLPKVKILDLSEL